MLRNNSFFSLIFKGTRRWLLKYVLATFGSNHCLRNRLLILGMCLNGVTPCKSRFPEVALWFPFGFR